MEPVALGARHENSAYYLTTRGGGSRRQTQDDCARANLLATQNKQMNKVVARILKDALDGKTKNQYKKGELPRRAEAINIGYLVPGKPGEPEIAPSEAFLDAFPNLAPTP